MAAYVIGDIKVTDPDTYAKYAAGFPPPVRLTGAGIWCGAWANVR